jgi:hypothetical protein
VTSVEETVVNEYVRVCIQELFSAQYKRWGDSTGTTGIVIMAAVGIFYLRMKREYHMHVVMNFKIPIEQGLQGLIF